MRFWLYQMAGYTPNGYRLECWEGREWQWEARRVYGGQPDAGDGLAFYFAGRSGDSGFYGWGVAMKWAKASAGPGGWLTFRLVPPSDSLKMAPWTGQKAFKLADQIRGKQKRGTMWAVAEQHVATLRYGVTSHHVPRR
jgi:hypothetical protein